MSTLPFTAHTILQRTLSHVDLAEQDAEQYKPLCKEGQTILTNFMIDGTTGIVLGLTYLRKEQDVFVTHTLRDIHYTAVPIRWNFQSCAFPWPLPTDHLDTL